MPPGTEHLEIAPAPFSELRSGNLPLDPLSRFCQRRADHLAQQETVALVRIVYQNPCTQRHESVWSDRLDSRLSDNLRNDLNSETWLTEFPSVLSLTQISLKRYPYFGYICLIGYRNQQPEYVLSLAVKPITTDQKKQLVETTACLIDFIELYQNSLQKQSEIHLLEQVVHRVGHQLRQPAGSNFTL